jgi:hypothetical protein
VFYCQQSLGRVCPFLFFLMILPRLTSDNDAARPAAIFGCSKKKKKKGNLKKPKRTAASSSRHPTAALATTAMSQTISARPASRSIIGAPPLTTRRASLAHWRAKDRTHTRAAAAVGGAHACRTFFS